MEQMSPLSNHDIDDMMTNHLPDNVQDDEDGGDNDSILLPIDDSVWDS